MMITPFCPAVLHDQHHQNMKKAAIWMKDKKSERISGE
jgi:hypothetical protein